MHPASGSLSPLSSLGLPHIRQQWSSILESGIHALQSLIEHLTIDVDRRQQFFHPDIDGLGASADLFLKFGIPPEIDGSCCSHECKSVAPKGAVVLACF